MPEKIIDAHTHYSNVQAFYGAADSSGVDYTHEGYVKEQTENNITASVCMGLVETQKWAFPDHSSPTPMYPDLDADKGLPIGLNICLGINPHTLNEDSLKKIRQAISQDRESECRIVGFKIYAGYYHFMIHDPIYSPIYKIAAEHNLSVAIHTGDTYSEVGLLEYSHAVAADRLAVSFRDTKFLLCHMGEPRIMDAVEVADKNRNVYLDISGLQAGDAKHIQGAEQREKLMHHYTQGLQYLNKYEKVLFGTDWPLVPMGAYIEFCKKLVPEYSYADVFL
jgi:hypothetical protein